MIRATGARLLIGYGGEEGTIYLGDGGQAAGLCNQADTTMQSRQRKLSGPIKRSLKCFKGSIKSMLRNFERAHVKSIQGAKNRGIAIGEIKAIVNFTYIFI